MAEYGLSPQGFRRKQYPDILADMQTRAKSFFGEDVNLSERSPLGMFLQIIAWEYARLWELAERVYYSGYVDDAEGKQLDAVTKYAAITRKGPQPAKGYILVTGTEGAQVTPEFIVGTKNGIYFRPDATYMLGAEPTRVNIVCVEAGKVGNVPKETINEIVTPLAGVENVINPEPTEGGQDAEKDDEFRTRYYRSLSVADSSTRAAVEAALLSMPDVKDALVEENDTMEIKDGLPPKCIAPYVFGGDDTEIALTILRTKAGGIQSYGTTEVQVQDSRGYTHTIGFSRPVSKDIYVKVTVTKNAQYPADGDIQVRTAVIEYIGGQDHDGTEFRGLRLGQDVVHSKIVAAVNKIQGIDDVVVELSTDGVSYSPSNISISQMEIATTDYEKVAVL